MAMTCASPSAQCSIYEDRVLCNTMAHAAEDHATTKRWYSSTDSASPSTHRELFQPPTPPPPCSIDEGDESPTGCIRSLVTNQILIPPPLLFRSFSPTSDDDGFDDTIFGFADDVDGLLPEPRTPTPAIHITVNDVATPTSAKSSTINTTPASACTPMIKISEPAAHHPCHHPKIARSKSLNSKLHAAASLPVLPPRRINFGTARPAPPASASDAAAAAAAAAAPPSDPPRGITRSRSANADLTPARRRSSVLRVSRRWKISAEDAAEICSNFERQQSDGDVDDICEAPDGFTVYKLYL